MNAFGSAYASAYDAIYQDKDYKGECDLLIDVLQEADGADLKRVLDLGSGTGSHAVILAERGIEVVGVDRSPDMTAIAQTKAAALPAGQRPEFVTGDVRSARLGRTFDAAIMMFAVLGYQHTNGEVIEALATARAHLEVGALFAFDIWYGPAVLTERPSDRIHVANHDLRTVIRVASGSLDVRTHLCAVDYHLWTLEGDLLVDEVTEHHVMRFFFPLELELLLDRAGFSLVRLGDFYDFAIHPDHSTRNVLALARAQ